jgi:hypothetical protein
MSGVSEKARVRDSRAGEWVEPRAPRHFWRWSMLVDDSEALRIASY